MKIRLVEEYDPISDVSLWYVQKRRFLMWEPVWNTYVHTEERSRAMWARVKRGRFERETVVIAEAGV